MTISKNGVGFGIVAIIVLIYLGVVAQNLFCSAVDKYEGAVKDTFGKCSYNVVTDGTTFAVKSGRWISSNEFPTKAEAMNFAIRRKVSCEEDKEHEKKQWREVE